MKTLLLIDNLNAGGAQNQIKNLSFGMKELGVDVELLTYTIGDHFNAVIEERGIKITHIQKSSRFDFLLPFKIYNYCKKNQITHIVAFLFTPSFYALFARLCSFGKIKVVVSERSYVRESKSADFTRRFYKQAHFITANSRHQSNYLKQRFSLLADKIKFVPNGIELTSVQHVVDKIDSSLFKIICVGRVQEIKNTKVIIKLLHHLIYDMNVSCEVNWVGSEQQLIEGETDPYFHDCVNLIHELKLEAHWNWLGRRKDVKELMAHSDLLIHASAGEGFPNVVIEAMSVHCLVLVSDFGDHPEVVKNAVNGFVFELKKPESLHDKMNEILNLSNRTQILQNARKTVEKDFSIEKLAQNYLNLLNA